MRLYKPLSRWWDGTHGGEHRGHVDFEVEPGESLAQAIAEVFSDAEDAYWWTPVRKGRLLKVHLELAVYEAEEESS